MVKKSTSYISFCLLLLWSIAQFVDVWHHTHEEHEEEYCHVNDAHYCAPHLEIELCSLCVVVHGNALQLFPDPNSQLNELAVSNETTVKSGFYSNYVATQSSRGPPA